MRNAARALVTLGFVGICAAIFYLTAQGPTESVALSSRFDAFLKSVVAHTGSDGLLAQLVQQIPVRRIGHTGEFFAFGALASVLVIVWFSQRMSVGTMMLASLGACMAGSLFDQTHKLFVPVRHFDWKDLPFDAFGYLAAVVVVFGRLRNGESVGEAEGRLEAARNGEAHRGVLILSYDYSGIEGRWQRVERKPLGEAGCDGGARWFA
mgnify:CR=1 FL=1